MSGKKIASENGSYKNFSGLIFCRGAEIKVKGADFILCYDYFCMNGGSVIDVIVSSASIANSVWLNGICDFGFFRKVDWRNGVCKNGEFLYSKWKKGTFSGGNFKDSVWNDGKFVSGCFIDSNWNDGIWMGGLWLRSSWKTGVDRNGAVHNGILPKKWAFYV